MTRVLVVASDPRVAAELAHQVRLQEWDAEIVGDALSALGAASRGHFDIVLLSGRLPGGGQVLAVQRMRSSVYAAGVPVIVVGSELDSPADRAALLAAGANEYLEPPVDPPTLAFAVQRNLRDFQVPRIAPATDLGRKARLAALAQITPEGPLQDSMFDTLTRLATTLLGVPAAALMLVSDSEQVWRSQIGVGEPWASRGRTPLTHSFCQWVVSGDEAVVISDARLHPVLSQNDAVADLGVVAYAGVPVAHAHESIGSFCAIDVTPREWSKDDLAVLADLAALAELQFLLLAQQHGVVEPRESVVPIRADAVRAAARIAHHRHGQLDRAGSELMAHLIDRETGVLQVLALR